MARGGKNEVTLTFAGDSDQLEKAADRVGSTLKGLESDVDRSSRSVDDSFDRIGSSAKGLEGDLDHVGSGVDNMQRRLGSGRRGAEDMAQGLDRLENAGGDTETRFVGLASGIDGATTLMQDPSPQEFAQAIGDLGDATEHTLAPALKSAKERVGGLISGFKEGGGAGGVFKQNMVGIAAGVAGAAAAIGLMTMVVMDNRRRAQEAQRAQTDWTDALQRSGGEMRTAAIAMVDQNDRYDLLRRMLSQTGMSMEEFVERSQDGTLNLERMAEASNLSTAETWALISAVGQYTSDQERAAEATEHHTRSINETIDELTAYGDALRAQYDPLFGMMDAQQANADAQANLRFAQLGLNDAIAEHGPRSMEAAAAQQALTDAERQAREAVVGLEGAATDLRIAVQNGTVRAGEARSQFIEMATSMGYSRGEAQRMASQFGFTTREAQRLGGQKPRVNVAAPGAQQAWNQLFGIRQEVNRIPNYKRIQVEQVFNKLFSGGGVVYAAAGMPARGTDTVPAMLTPGEMVLNAGQQAELWAMANGHGRGGGGLTVNLYVQGSVHAERDLAKVVETGIRNGDIRGVLQR